MSLQNVASLVPGDWVVMTTMMMMADWQKESAPFIPSSIPELAKF
jgi:hypothetical protein